MAGSAIAFATLWLGLVSGDVTVELEATAAVAAIELRLDGAAVARLASPPWRTVVGLGEGLLPHRLEAWAFDAAGAPIGRVEQRLNLPRPPAELGITVEAGAGRVTARLAWEAVEGARPSAVVATLDGRPLPLPRDLARLELPGLDLAQPHLLRVEVRFENGAVASRETVIGGGYGDVLERDLTALAIEGEARRPQAAGIAVEAGGRPLPVLAVEEGLADLVVVAGPGARAGLVALADEASARLRGVGPRVRGGRIDLAYVAPLGGAHRLRVLSPLPRRAAGSRFDLDLFAPTPERSPFRGGLLAHLLRDAPPRGERPRLADAVALAGLDAVERSRRRAVLLLVGAGDDDASLYTPAAARRYLAALRVPLLVASTAPPSPELAEAWGEVTALDSLAAFEGLVRDLVRRLDRQRVVWVAGSFLPQEARLVAPVRTRLAGDVDLRPLAGLAMKRGGAPLAASATPGETRAAPAPPDPLADLPPIPAGFSTRPLGRFVLHTDVGDEATLTVLAAVAAALPAVWSARYGAAVERPVNGELGAVVLFARRDDFVAFLGRDDPEADPGVRGRARAASAVLALGDEPLDELQAILVHELAHLLARRAFGPPLPPWLEEGLAEDLAMSRLDDDGRLLPGTLRGRTRLADPGLPSRRGARAVEIRSEGAHGALASLLDARRRGAVAGLAELLAMDAARFTHADGRRDRYSAAAFLVRFLLDAQGEATAGAFRAFVRAVAAGGRGDAVALSAAVGEPLPTLERRFEGWLRLQRELTR